MGSVVNYDPTRIPGWRSLVGFRKQHDDPSSWRGRKGDSWWWEGEEIPKFIRTVGRTEVHLGVLPLFLLLSRLFNSVSICLPLSTTPTPTPSPLRFQDPYNNFKDLGRDKLRDNLCSRGTEGRGGGERGGKRGEGVKRGRGGGGRRRRGNLFLVVTQKLGKDTRLFTLYE